MVRRITPGDHLRLLVVGCHINIPPDRVTRVTSHPETSLVKGVSMVHTTLAITTKLLAVMGLIIMPTLELHPAIILAMMVGTEAMDAITETGWSFVSIVSFCL